MGRQSVERALDILSLFSISRPQLSIKDISDNLNLSKPTVHGLVRTLLARGFMAQDPGTKKYSLGLNIYELGTVLSGTLKINQVAAGPVRTLVQETTMTARVGIWDQDNILVIDTIYPNFRNFQFCPPGPRVPAYCSSTGKAVLAALPEPDFASYISRTPFFSYTSHTITTKEALIENLREFKVKGYTVDCEEYMLGIACIGAPILDANRYPIAAISLSGPPDKILGKRISKLAEGLVLTARDISIYMGFSEGVPAKRRESN
jgi:DNA-binding IclR family transcriptional regulator